MVNYTTQQYAEFKSGVYFYASREWDRMVFGSFHREGHKSMMLLGK